jgi:AraC-like DNA-binding protein
VQSRLPREDAARALCLSPVQFSRNFRKVFGCSFRTAQVFLRLHLGAHYLSYTPLRITEIADKLQYGDLKKFERAFKQHFHMSPSHYRWRRKQEAADDTWILSKKSLQEVQNEISRGNTDPVYSAKISA